MLVFAYVDLTPYVYIYTCIVVQHSGIDYPDGVLLLSYVLIYVDSCPQCFPGSPGWGEKSRRKHGALFHYVVSTSATPNLPYVS